MREVEYISEMEDSVKVSWSNSKHDGEAAFKLSERSRLPPAVSAKELAGGPTLVFIVR